MTGQDGYPLVVTARTPLADDVVEFTLRAAADVELPAWEPGAHVDVVTGMGVVRQYSLCGDPADRGSYRIAVLRQSDGRGGSAWLHANLRPGDEVIVRGPRNHFPLEPARRYVFVAGGVGVTPLLPMVREVATAGAEWSLHYGGRTRTSMAYADELLAADPRRVAIVPQDECGFIDLPAAISGDQGPPVVYCCGPEPLIAAVESVCAARGLRLRTERFAPRAAEPGALDTAFVVELASTGAEFDVPADRSIVDVLLDAGVDLLTSCEEGTCGTCETAVLAGTPDHRDAVLTPDEQAAGDRLLPCVSRARTARLVLDL